MDTYDPEGPILERLKFAYDKFEGNDSEFADTIADLLRDSLNEIIIRGISIRSLEQRLRNQEDVINRLQDDTHPD